MKLKKKISNLHKRFIIFIKNVWHVLKKTEMSVLPGQIAFSIILSIVPIITLIGFGASYFNISMNSIIDLIRNNFSDAVADMLVPIVSGETLDFNLVIMLISMLYFASDGPSSIIYVANEIYGIKQESFIKRKLKAIVMTFLIIILYLFILLVPAFGEVIIGWIDYFNIKSILTNILEIMQGPISWIIIFIFIKLIFTMSPNKSIEPARINIGAIFTSFGWIITTEIYSFYVSHFAKYDIFYAGLSNVMVLMLWIYFLSYILVIGLSLTIEIKDEDLPLSGKINKL